MFAHNTMGVSGGLFGEEQKFKFLNIFIKFLTYLNILHLFYV